MNNNILDIDTIQLCNEFDNIIQEEMLDQQDAEERRDYEETIREHRYWQM